jgi:anti-sigma B factor antagonist
MIFGEYSPKKHCFYRFLDFRHIQLGSGCILYVRGLKVMGVALEIKTITVKDGLVVFALDVNNLDASNITTFRKLIQPLIEKFRHIVFDMNGVEFVDSSGLGALIACQRALKDRNGAMRLAAMGPSVRALFELTRITRVFQIFDSRGEAVDSALKTLDATKVNDLDQLKN